VTVAIRDKTMVRAKVIAVGLAGVIVGMVVSFIVFVAVLWSPTAKAIEAHVVKQQLIDRAQAVSHLKLLDMVLANIRGAQGMSHLVEDLEERRAITRERLDNIDAALKAFGVKPPPVYSTTQNRQ